MPARALAMKSGIMNKADFESGALFHGTPEQINRPSVRDSRLRGVFFTPVREVAEHYAGPNGTVVAVRPKQNARIIDASGTHQDEHWHWIERGEWEFILSEAERRGVTLTCNYDLLRNKPLPWEAFFDPNDGPAASAPSGFIEDVLGSLGYDGVSSHDPFGFLGDVYKRHGEQAYDKAKNVLKKIGEDAAVPVVVFFADDAFVTYEEYLRDYDAYLRTR